MPKRRARLARSGGEEFIGLLLGILGAYLGAETLLARFIHPIHWLVAGAGGAVGYFAVLSWYRWRRPQRPR